MNNHTPGPWKAFNASWCETFITAPNFDHGICCLDINHATEESQDADESQMAANANLIASAPELLSALEAVAGEVTDGVRPTSADSHLPADIVRLVHSAIAKATGKAES